MKPLSALRASPPVPAVGARGRPPGSARRRPPHGPTAHSPAADTPFDQLVADNARSLAELSAASRAAPAGSGAAAAPGPPPVADRDEQPAEAAVIAALCDAERRGLPRGGG